MASSTERGRAGGAAKCLDPLSIAMPGIANQRMKVSVCNPEIPTLVIGAGESLGIYAFGCSSAAFELAVGAHRRRCKSYNRRVGIGEATVGQSREVSGGAGGVEL